MLFTLEDIPQMTPPVKEHPRPKARRKRARKPQQLCLLDLLAPTMLVPRTHKQVIN
ncbi:protein of unknown function [Methylorubrum extorquens]|uniref:Uncharacterized protein n=1 Tax=Methylorubrum extorquens TaxID=408 RepID=A0A2N9AN47_METEX|nr:protein of unknown function [Methylorubrum extorquens]